MQIFSIAGFGFSIFTTFAFIFTSYIFIVKVFSKSKNFINKLNVLLLIFGSYLIISKTFPLFAGDVTVLPYTKDYLEFAYVPLEKNITGLRNLFYPLLYIFTSIAISAYIKTYTQLVISMNAFLYGILFVGISGFLFQLYAIYDQNSSLSLLSELLYGNIYTDDILARVNYQSYGDISRMYTFAGEPGFSANLFIIALAFTLSISLLGLKKPGQKHFFQNRYLIFIFLFFALMTLSTTAYLGLALASFISFVLVSKNKLKNIAIFAFIALLMVFLIITIDEFRSYLVNNHLNKISGESGSGYVRILNLQHSYDLFLTNPIFGIGYGSHRSTTLILSLLVNIGLVGTMIYLYILFKISLFDINKLITNPISTGLAVAIIVWTLLSMVSQTGVSLLFPWIWVAIGMQMSYPAQLK
jgi:hypothetical protein